MAQLIQNLGVLIYNSVGHDNNIHNRTDQTGICIIIKWSEKLLRPFFVFVFGHIWCLPPLHHWQWKMLGLQATQFGLQQGYKQATGKDKTCTHARTHTYYKCSKKHKLYRNHTNVQTENNPSIYTRYNIQVASPSRQRAVLTLMVYYLVECTCV